MKALGILWNIFGKTFEIAAVLYVLLSLHDRSLSILVSLIGIVYVTILTISSSQAQFYAEKIVRIEAAILQIRQSFAEGSREPASQMISTEGLGLSESKYVISTIANIILYAIFLINVFIHL